MIDTQLPNRIKSAEEIEKEWVCSDNPIGILGAMREYHNQFAAQENMKKTVELPEDIKAALIRLGFKGNAKDGQEICDWFREKHDILISVRTAFNVPKWETKFGYVIDGANRRGSSASEDYVHGRPQNMIGIIGHPKDVILPSCRVEYYEAMAEGIKHSIQFIKS